jgi:hypothetical protein
MTTNKVNQIKNKKLYPLMNAIIQENNELTKDSAKKEVIE